MTWDVANTAKAFATLMRRAGEALISRGLFDIVNIASERRGCLSRAEREGCA